MPDPRTTTIDLTRLPDGASPRSVTAVPADIAGHHALRVALTETARRGRPGIDYVDQPTFVRIPAEFRDGTLQVDVLSRLTADAPADARAFAGLAYRVTGDVDAFEAVYLRPLNGRKTNPPPPRDRRAVQYFAYPDHPFDRLRTDHPDGRYEAAADIGPDEWIHLRLDIHDTTVTATVDGHRVLTLTETKAAPATGDVGLFVDIGTEAYFRDLTITG